MSREVDRLVPTLKNQTQRIIKEGTEQESSVREQDSVNSIKVV